MENPVFKSNPNFKNSLMLVANSVNYQMKTGSAVLSALNSESNITITAQNRRFWVTDFVPVIYNSDGTIPDGKNFPTDDILIEVKVGEMQMTDRPIPLSTLLHKNNDDMFSGKIIEPNNSITFRIYSKQLGSPTPKCNYPVTIYMTLKGYELNT